MPEQVVIVKAEQKQAANVVTSENREAFMAKKLDLAPAEPPKAEEKKPEAKAEAKPEEKKEEAKAEDDKKDGKKHELNERFSKLTADRKAAEAKAAAAEARAAEAEKARVEAEAKLAPKKEEPKVGSKPQRAQFTTDDDYLEALADHKVDERLAERDAKAAADREKEAQTARLDTWKERYAAAQKEIPDFDEKIDGSRAVVSDQVRDAIIASEVGPRILLHFAEHPEEAAKIAKMTVGDALRAVGRIEGRLEDAAKTVTPEKKAENVVEISKAPPPISPLKGNGAVPEVPVDSAGVFKGTFAEWKALRRAGKI